MGFLKEKLGLPFETFSSSVEETKIFAKSLGEAIFPFELIAFFGEMGAGKTAFVSGFASAFNISSLVCSPTFSIVNEYLYSEEKKIVHCDMYRIKTEQDLYTTGFLDYLKDENAIVLVEWSENILNFLPEQFYRVEIKVLDETKREIKISEEKK